MTTSDVPLVDSDCRDDLRRSLDDYLLWLEASQYAPTTIRSRARDLRQFVAWCRLAGVPRLSGLAAPLVEQYKVVLHTRRGPRGRLLGDGTKILSLLAVKRFLAWASRMKLTPWDLAEEVALPRRPDRLPRNVLSASEVERILAEPDVHSSRGLRDRAILETFYSTGMRRLELIKLAVADVMAERGVIMIRAGKGARDRVVPVGRRALGWIERYETTRPTFVRGPDPGILFLTRRGRPLQPNRLSEMVRGYIDAAELGKGGSCHLFRHSTATLMLEAGADIRAIQELLGHKQLTTTQIYTRVSIGRLKEVHQRTHPAEQSIQS